MADIAEYTEFWVACAAAGPVLLIPTYLMVRQERAGSSSGSGLSVASVGFLAAGTIFALIQLSSGTPVHGKVAGRVIELILICGPIVLLVVSLMRGRDNGRRPPGVDELGLPSE